MQTTTIRTTTYRELKQKATLYDRLSRGVTHTDRRSLSCNVLTDEQLWQEMRPTMKKIRAELFKKTYPKLYAKLQKEKAR
jgi:succinylarginine dihydrolase